MNVSVVGGGFVGVATAITLSEQGHAVAIVEADPVRASALAAGRAPFHEPGVNEALSSLLAAGRLALHDRFEAAPPADFVFLCVGTPERPDGSADLRQVASAAEQVGRASASWARAPVVVVKSTVPPGTTRDIVVPALRKSASRALAAANPEFLREGSALADARAPDRIVVGAIEPEAEERLRGLFAGAGVFLGTSAETAETIKYASNGLLATKIAFANELANFCETIGVNVDDVVRGVGLDRRIGPHFLHAGVGFGGSCFPKDLAALRALAAQRGVRLGVVDAVLASNDTQPRRVVDLARESLGGLAGRRIALLGLAFKPHTSDVRETRALPIWRALVAEGADVIAYDPVAGEEFRALEPKARLAPDLETALAGADAAILQTEWPEFRALMEEPTTARMRRRIIVDGRRLLDPVAARRVGLQVVALGDGRPEARP